MPATTPDYAKVADELAARAVADADAWVLAQLESPSEPPLAGDPRVVLRLLRLRFAARVARELGFQVDRLAQQARDAGAAEDAIADARADRSPAGMRAEVPADQWRPKDA